MGTHLSFVRSIELDKFHPEQLVQMTCGCNASAWAFFKQHGMGKTSDGGRKVEYAGNVATRYKQQLQKQTRVACEQLTLASKPSSLVTSDSTQEQMITPTPTSPPVEASVEAPSVFEPPALVSSPSAPTVIAATIAEPARSRAKTEPQLRPQPRPQPGGVKAAKQIDFDFDFDELENEASKPVPTPAPAPAPASIPAPQPTMKQHSMMSNYDSSVTEKSAPKNNTEHQSKFSNAKAISSDDFFGDDSADKTSFSDQIMRDHRYLQFSGATAISSDNFFGDGPTAEEGESNWRGVAEKGVDIAKAGLFKGKDLLTTYLNKAYS